MGPPKKVLEELGKYTAVSIETGTSSVFDDGKKGTRCTRFCRLLPNMYRLYLVL